MCKMKTWEWNQRNRKVEQKTVQSFVNGLFHEVTSDCRRQLLWWIVCVISSWQGSLQPDDWCGLCLKKKTVLWGEHEASLLSGRRFVFNHTYVKCCGVTNSTYADRKEIYQLMRETAASGAKIHQTRGRWNRNPLKMGLKKLLGSSHWNVSDWKKTKLSLTYLSSLFGKKARETQESLFPVSFLFARVEAQKNS